MKDEFERLLIEKGSERYRLKLYVTGMTPRSTDAVAVVKSICDDLLAGRFELHVVDLYEHPAEATESQIIAAPTLVRETPAPPRRLIGNLGDRERVIRGLDLPEPGDEIEE
jgi:circadian clock protein KaiB